MRSLNVIFSVVISLFYRQVEDVADLRMGPVDVEIVLIIIEAFTMDSFIHIYK